MGAGKFRVVQAPVEAHLINTPAGSLRTLKRLFRRAFPRRPHPLLDTESPPSDLDVRWETAYRGMLAGRRTPDAGRRTPDAGDDNFLRARYREGMRWRSVLERFLASPSERGGRPRLLDVGAGNGAVELALSAGGFEAVSVEILWNPDAIELQRRSGRRLSRVIADIGRLPFGDRVFDGATCLEVIEHATDPTRVGAELCRVTRDGGVILLTTPPRVRYLLGRDPHFGIRGLLLLPARLQRRLAARRGFRGPHHYVGRIFWTAGSVARLFSGCAGVEILNRSRLPSRFFWDAIVFRRGRSPGAEARTPAGR